MSEELILDILLGVIVLLQVVEYLWRLKVQD